jgi:hypothetical protein
MPVHFRAGINEESICSRSHSKVYKTMGGNTRITFPLLNVDSMKREKMGGRDEGSRMKK